jgi:hypothetical protein
MAHVTRSLNARLRPLLFVGALSIAAQAQQAAPSPAASYELRIYAPGVDPANGEPSSLSTIPAQFTACNQVATVVPAVTMNPSRIRWADPDHPGRECGADVPAFFSALPPAAGPYLATLTAIDQFGSRSDASLPSNIFFRTAASGAAAARRKD